MTNAESVKARLRNLEIKEGGTMQDKLTMYALERSIYRLSVSKYADRFTLKGGIFLYALFDRKFARATRDVDLLAQKIPNDVEKMEKVFLEIFSIDYDDALRYDMDSLKVQCITEFKEYHGVNVFINTYLNRTRIPVSIDIGFGDVVYPNRERMNFPVLLDMEKPKVFVYSIYSVIAEKFEALTSLGIANSRYKDFYDIYILAKRFDMSGLKLKDAIQCTFVRRGTGMNDIVVFQDEFTMDIVRRNRWNAFVQKKKTMEKISFEDVIGLLKDLLMPIVDAIQSDADFNKEWSYEEKTWK